MENHMEMNMTQKRHKMWMWYHVELEDTILFEQWTAFDAGTMVWSCFVVAFAAFLLEFFKYFRWVMRQKMTSSTSSYNISQNGNTRTTRYGMTGVTDSAQSFLSASHFSQTFVHFFQLVLSYLLMNVYMTFSVYICMSLCLGLSIGYFFFGSRIH